MIRRESPWGPIHVIDAHVHFFSHRFFSALASQKPDLTLEGAQEILDWEFPQAEPESLGERWVAELNAHSVQAAAMIASIPGDEGSVIAAAAKHPERLLPYAMVNPKTLQLDNLANIRAACLFPAMHLYSIQDECVRPVFEWAQREKRVVFIHCGVLSVGVRKKLGLPSPFDLKFSNPIDLHAVALRYPDVPIVIPHFGAGYFREALMVASLCSNVHFDTSSSNEWVNLQVPPINLRGAFEQALKVLGPQRLLFGTDSSFFPRGWQHPIFDTQATALYELGATGTDAQAIFGDNLLRILAR
ncbi:MAG: amidohydrolase family protein [Bryobacteraceae bacterium]